MIEKFNPIQATRDTSPADSAAIPGINKMPDPKTAPKNNTVP